jgi:poly-beta-1,6-N-acetyl-D-glucosamine biosynthesis protein PgaD
MPAHIQVSLLGNRPLIFIHARQDSKTEWAISLLIDAAGWGIWLYLWKVMITSVAWYFGLHLAYQEWGNHSGFNQFLAFVDGVAIYGVGLCAVAWVWALQDIWRFRTERRRVDTRFPSPEKDCLWTSIMPAELQQSRSQKILVCTYSAEGELISAKPFKP